MLAAVPEPRAVRRHATGYWRCKLGLLRQAARAPELR
ncbi:hypothetical protein M1724_23415 [Salmonella enterica subsp. enterica serovar Typhimurium]|nr:hypothetical protein [Salmonella enterica]MCT7166857.1 hypothetical protein [Salmonella enterica subsp. enterica serovar Typhimurium]